MKNVPLLAFQDIDPDVVKSITINNVLYGTIHRIKNIYNFSSYPVLESIIAKYQLLKNIDVTQNSNLNYLDCSYNNLSSIDVTKNLELITLNCESNLLESIDLTGNPYLENLNIDDNFIDLLDLSENGNLKSLSCASNQFTGSINLITNNELLKLDISDNDIDSINLAYTPNLQQLTCSNNNINLIDFSPINTLTGIDCQNNEFPYVRLSGNNPNLVNLYCGTNHTLGVLTIGSKPYLKYLNSGNAPNLGEIDVTGCPVLETLILNSCNLLNTIDLTSNTNLISLTLTNTAISTIDFSSQTNLEYLNCSFSGLTALDLSNSTKISTLIARDCSITSVTLSATNTSTSDNFVFDFSNNKLNSSATNAILEKLDGYGISNGFLYISGAFNEGPSGTGLTYYSSLISKGWTIDSNIPYPSITSFSPGTGMVGDTVTITGIYFSGATAVKFNNVAATSFTVDSNIQITVTVPTGATSGKIRVETPGGFILSATNFNVTAQPAVVSSFTPVAGLIGSVITISGDFFTGTTDVSFNGIPATFTEVSNIQLTATVPAGTTTGPITVTNALGIGTSATNFTPVLTPTITSFTPASGLVGSFVQITGSQFGFVSNVKINNVTSAYTVVTSTGIKATVPTTTTGFITVTTAGGTATTDPSEFTVIIPAPTITSFTPNQGSVATSVTITGTNLLGATRVSFNDVASDYYTIPSSTQIIAAVPVGFVSTGKVALKTGGGAVTSSADFTYAAPTERLECTPSSITVNWYTAENYGGTATNDVSLTYFRSNVTPSDVYTLEFPDDSNITTIANLSTYTNLKTLDLTFQNLSSLNLTGNSSIKQVYCDNNDLTSLDLSNNNVITTLSCTNNNLTSLTSTNMSALTLLNCSNCTLPSLTLTTNTALQYLTANINNLTSLNLSNNTSLLTLDVSENQLSSLSLTANTALQTVNIGTNSLTGAFNVSTNTALVDFNCESNTITSLTGLSSLSNLQKLTITNNSFSSINLSSLNNLTEFYASVNSLTSVTMKSSVNITTTYHFDVSYNNLSSAQVNTILQTIDGYTTPSGNNLTDKFIDVSGGTNGAPTGAGLTALTSLRNKGYNVLTN